VSHARQFTASLLSTKLGDSSVCHHSGLASLLPVLLLAEVCYSLYLWCSVIIQTLLQDSTSNGPCKDGVSVNELMYNVHLFFTIRAGIANDDHFVKKVSH